jgi:hypothetical protein
MFSRSYEGVSDYQLRSLDVGLIRPRTQHPSSANRVFGMPEQQTHMTELGRTALGFLVEMQDRGNYFLKLAKMYGTPPNAPITAETFEQEVQQGVALVGTMIQCGEINTATWRTHENNETPPVSGKIIGIGYSLDTELSVVLRTSEVPGPDISPTQLHDVPLGNVLGFNNE